MVLQMQVENYEDMTKSLLILRLKKMEQRIAEFETFEANKKESLTDNEEINRLIVENANEGIVVVQNQVICFMNPKVLEFTGYSEEELNSADFTHFIHPDDRKMVLENHLKIIDEGVSSYHNPFRVFDKQGNVKWVESNSVLISWEGEPAVLSLLNDITERKKKEKALKESEERYRKLVRISPEAIAVADLEGRINEVSEQAIELFGVKSAESVFERDAFEFIAPQDHKKAKAYVEKLLKEEYIKNVEFNLLKNDGSSFIGEISASLIKDNQGEPISFIATIRDITEKKRIEESMKRKLTKFRVEEGSIYLAKEQTLTESLEAFKDLLKVGYSGVIITRTPREKFKHDIDDNIRFWWISRRVKGSLPSNPKEIESRIESISKMAILIDCLDCMISENGFKRSLDFVINLREISYLNNHIIILSIDPSTLPDRKMKILEREINELLPRDIAKLPKAMFDILRFVYRCNKLGIHPTYTEIGDELGISKPTVRKRIRSLVSHDYLIESVKGRVKMVEVTEKTRKLFLD